MNNIIIQVNSNIENDEFIIVNQSVFISYEFPDGKKLLTENGKPIYIMHPEEIIEEEGKIVFKQKVESIG